MNNYSYNIEVINMHNENLISGLSEFFKVLGDTTRLRILD